MHIDEIRSFPASTILSSSDMDSVDIDALFTVDEVSDEVFSRMKGFSFKPDCELPREELRYLRALHKNLEGDTLIGEMVVNKRVAQDVSEILRELYRAGYPIERMMLIDEYHADDEKSMRANNSSSFNFRVIAGTDNLSHHALGCAVDINPFYNPYVTASGCFPEGSLPYADRSHAFSYKIEREDLCVRLFAEHGFSWGGDWEYPDYQHFEKIV